MPKIFPTLIQRVTTVISSVVNARMTTKPATSVSMVATLLAAKVYPATRVAFAPFIARIAQKPATAVSTVNSGTLVKPQAKPASTVTIPASGTVKPGVTPAEKMTFAPAIMKVSEKPATNMVQISFDLAHQSYVVTAAQDAGGTGTWQNPTRMQGAPAGTQAGSATFAGGLVLGTGKLRGTMVAQSNRPTTLIIDEVYLDFYGQTTGLPVVSDLISQLVLGYRINTSPLPGTDKDVEVLTSNLNFLGTPHSFRIDNGAGAFTDVTGTSVTWANIALIQPYFSATTIANGLMTYYADAVGLRVVAHEVQVL